MVLGRPLERLQEGSGGCSSPDAQQIVSICIQRGSLDYGYKIVARIAIINAVIGGYLQMR